MEQLKESFVEAAGVPCPVDTLRSRAAFRRGVEYLNTGRLEDAARVFALVVSAEPENGEAHCHLGQVHYSQGAFPEAESCFRRALAADQDNIEARYHLAILLGQTNRPAEAAECYLEVIERNPDDPEGHYLLAGALKELSLFDEAVSCLEESLRLDPQYGRAHALLGVIYHIQGRVDKAVAAFRLASRLGNDTPSNRHMLNALTGTRSDQPPEHYVAHLFDGYARRFDQSLVNLDYQTPMLMRRALDGISGPAVFQRGVDLGCGTGFSGLPFVDNVEHFTGVDLSRGMLAVAAGKDIYQELICDDLVGYLGGSGELYDLFLLIDVCVYLGRLDQVLTAVRQSSRPGARVLISIEIAGGTGDFSLKTSGRYGHSPAYLERLARENGMVVEYREKAGIRRERQEWIEGMVFILKVSGPLPAAGGLPDSRPAL